MSDALARVLHAVGEHKRSGSRYVCHCPVHEDRKPSLTVSLADDGKILLGCWAGCKTEEILHKLGLRWADLFPGNAGGAPAPLPKRRNKARPVLPAAKVPESNLKTLQRGFSAALADDQLRGLAWKLGVTVPALIALEIGWISALELERRGNARHEAAYTFPERNGRGQLVGFSLRWQDGAKGFLHGTNRGLVIPRGLHRMAVGRPVIAVEGASDVAALLGMNLPAIGRPSNTGGVEHLAYYCRDLHLMVMGENDKGPGVVGARLTAEKLAVFWKRPVTWLLPPPGAKDVREWLRSVVSGQWSVVSEQPDVLLNIGQRLLYESSWHVAGNESAAKRMDELRRRKVMS